MRWKTYSAESGYVYQYVYAGGRDHEPETEYVFHVSADRKTSFPVDVRLSATDDGLTDTERYGVAKMCLLQALDAWTEPPNAAATVRPSATDVARARATLDL